MLFGSKSNAIRCCQSNCNCHIVLDGITLNQVNVSKFRGVFIDDKLNWKQHILFVNSKISKNLGIIRKVHYKLPSSALLSLYYALIAPNLSYCDIVWASTYVSNLECLLKTQKKAVRFIAHSKLTLPGSESF